MTNRWGNNGNNDRLYLFIYFFRLYFFGLLGFKITVDGDCSHGIKRYLFLGTKAMTNLDSILKKKYRDTTLPTKVRLAKDMVFPVVMYGCESWTIEKS